MWLLMFFLGGGGACTALFKTGLWCGFLAARSHRSDLCGSPHFHPQCCTLVVLASGGRIQFGFHYLTTYFCLSSI